MSAWIDSRDAKGEALASESDSSDRADTDRQRSKTRQAVLSRGLRVTFGCRSTPTSRRGGNGVEHATEALEEKYKDKGRKTRSTVPSSVAVSGAKTIDLSRHIEQQPGYFARVREELELRRSRRWLTATTLLALAAALTSAR